MRPLHGLGNRAVASLTPTHPQGVLTLAFKGYPAPLVTLKVGRHAESIFGGGGIAMHGAGPI